LDGSQLTKPMTDTTFERLTRAPLPSTLTRVRLELPPDTGVLTTAAAWRGTLAVVECGKIEVRCHPGVSRVFVEGSYVPLSCLPVRSLHNPGSEPAILVAVSRRGDR
jgi:hypothetical protein